VPSARAAPRRPVAAEGLTRNSWSPREPSCQEHDGRCIEKRGSGCGGPFEVLGEAAVSADPGEQPLDDSEARQDDEADLVGRLVDDYKDDPRGVGDGAP